MMESALPPTRDPQGHDVNTTAMAREVGAADPSTVTDASAARMLRRIRGVACLALVVAAVGTWQREWTIPGPGPGIVALAGVVWLQGTNAWAKRQLPTPRTARIEVASDALLGLVITIGGGALAWRTLPIVPILVVVEAATRLPTRDAWIVTAVYAGASTTAILTGWPSWAGWGAQVRAVEAVPAMLGLPIAAAIVLQLANERAHSHALAVGQSRRLTLAARQLRETNAQLAAANRELQAFTGRVAHDLRSPLATVASAMETLQVHDERLTSAARAELLERASRATRRSLDAITALLDHASAPTAVPDCRETDLAAVTADVVATLPPGAVGGVAIELPDGPSVVWADDRLLELVLQNLVLNALTHGGVDLTTVRVTGRWGIDAVEVAVEDDGVGIPSDHRASVFDGHLRTSHGPGFGLGLGTCAVIIERHGGRIWVDDSPLGGAAVRFTLPGPSPAQDGTVATSSSSGSSSLTSSAS